MAPASLTRIEVDVIIVVIIITITIVIPAVRNIPKSFLPHSTHTRHSLIIYLITDTGLRNPHDDKDSDVDDSLVALQDQQRMPFNYF